MSHCSRVLASLWWGKILINVRSVPFRTVTLCACVPLNFTFSPMPKPFHSLGLAEIILLPLWGCVCVRFKFLPFFGLPLCPVSAIAFLQNTCNFCVEYNNSRKPGPTCFISKQTGNGVCVCEREIGWGVRERNRESRWGSEWGRESETQRERWWRESERRRKGGGTALLSTPCCSVSL